MFVCENLGGLDKYCYFTVLLINLGFEFDSLSAYKNDTKQPQKTYCDKVLGNLSDENL